MQKALTAALATLIACIAPAAGQLALPGNDHKAVPGNGAVRIMPNPPADTVAILDLGSHPPRVVEMIGVGPTPEGIQVSPDGRHVGVVVINGSARAANHALHGRVPMDGGPSALREGGS